MRGWEVGVWGGVRGVGGHVADVCNACSVPDSSLHLTSEEEEIDVIEMVKGTDESLSKLSPWRRHLWPRGARP